MNYRQKRKYLPLRKLQPPCREAALLKRKPSDFAGYEQTQICFGGMRNQNGAYRNTFIGKLNEFRVWAEVRPLDHRFGNQDLCQVQLISQHHYETFDFLILQVGAQGTSHLQLPQHRWSGWLNLEPGNILLAEV
jgi:hypothetical protein